MAERNLEMLVRIQGELDGSMPESVRRAVADAGRLQESLAGLRSTMGKTQRLQQLQQEAAPFLSTAFLPDASAIP